MSGVNRALSLLRAQVYVTTSGHEALLHSSYKN